jgi:2''-5'' RNA ligase
MNPTSIIKMPGYRYCEYLLILNPHEELRNKIIHVKNEFASKYHSSNVNGKPHITLAKFTVWEMMEEKIINSLKVVAMANPPFKVFLKDYGSFPSHSIVINVDSKVAIRNLVKELRVARRLMRSPDNDPYFITDPYIPIATRLSPEQYEPAWLEYSHRHFTGSFIADSMLLLKRREGEKGYQIAQRFEFMNLPVSTRQGELF